jgi:hypothetical protein
MKWQDSRIKNKNELSDHVYRVRMIERAVIAEEIQLETATEMWSWKPTFATQTTYFPQ